MKTRFFGSLLILWLGVACSSEPTPDNSVIQEADKQEVQDTQEVKSLANEPTVDEEKPFPAIADILSIGQFHAEEVDPKDHELTWVGLFQVGEEWYLKNTFITTSRVFDPVLDEEVSEPTGWEVSPVESGKGLLLIAGLDDLAIGQVQRTLEDQEYLSPKDTLEWEYQGHFYRMWATGHRDVDQPNPDWYGWEDYHLYLARQTDVGWEQNLIISKESFEESMIRLLFAGDLDGDGYLDMILDISDHYNAYIPALYLSRPAPEGKFLIKVGEHLSVGC